MGRGAPARRVPRSGRAVPRAEASPSPPGSADRRPSTLAVPVSDCSCYYELLWSSFIMAVLLKPIMAMGRDKSKGHC